MSSCAQSITPQQLDEFGSAGRGQRNAVARGDVDDVLQSSTRRCIADVRVRRPRARLDDARAVKRHFDRVRWLLLERVAYHAGRAHEEHEAIMARMAARDVAGLTRGGQPSHQRDHRASAGIARSGAGELFRRLNPTGVLTMKIERVYTIVTCPGRNFVTLKIVTDEGVYGLGDATLNGRELAVKAYLDEHVIPCLIGRDPRNIEDIWQYLYRGAYWRRGPVTMAAIAAVDVALWDIKGKLAGMPVYQLLGGKSRDGAMVYGHANGRDHAETIEAVRKLLDEGLQGDPRAVRRARTGEGLRRRQGPGLLRAGREGSAARGAVGHLAVPAPYAGAVPQGARGASATTSHLLHDAHHRLTPIEAGAARQGLRAVPPVLDRGRDAGREPGIVPPDPPAHDDAAGGGRGLQFDLGLQGPHQRAADRLHPRDDRARRRHHARAPHRRLRGAVSGAHRLPRRDRPVAGVHGGGGQLRSVGAELRHPGADAAHAR